MKWLLLLLALPLCGCPYTGTNCGDQYTINYIHLASGEYEFVQGDMPAWLEGETLHIDYNQEARTLRLSNSTHDTTYPVDR